jgi:HlyD family secretion protein
MRDIFSRRRIWQAAVIAAAAVLGAVLFFAFRGKGSSPEYRTEIVSRGDIQAAVTATGTVNAVTTVLVGTQVSGTIKNIYADFNSPVKKGQLIAQIDPEMLEAQAAQAKANVEKADAAFRDAERTLKRNRELFSRNLIPRSDLDTAETNFDGSRAQLEQAKAALKVADTNLRYTRIISPVDGVVISRNVDVGQTVAASFQTPTLFTIAQDLTKMQIDTNVAEADIGSVKVGQEAEFTVDAYPDSTFKGRAWQIRRAPITVQNVVTYDVVIQVPNRDLRLMPGMTANVSIIIATKKDALKIPNGALRFRPSERRPEKASTGAERKGPAVWVLEKGTPKRVAITPGISDGNYTEVVSGELKEGQEIIVGDLTKPKGSPGRSGPRMF